MPCDRVDFVQRSHVSRTQYTIYERLCNCRDVTQYDQAEAIQDLLILRVNDPLCFANVEHIKDCIAQHEVRFYKAVGCLTALSQYMQLWLGQPNILPTQDVAERGCRPLSIF